MCCYERSRRRPAGPGRAVIWQDDPRDMEAAPWLADVIGLVLCGVCAVSLVLFLYVVLQ